MTVRHEGSLARIEAVDAHAARRGLHAGMRLSEALAVAGDLEVRPADPDADAEVLRGLARWAERFSPLAEPRKPDMLLLDVTGCAHLFGGEASLAGQLTQGIAAQGLTARVAIAETAAGARVLARGQAETPVICPPGQLRRRLEPIPVAALDHEPADVARLDALGIRTLGQLLRLPRDTLARRFSPTLVRTLAAAVGERPELLEAHHHEPPAQTACRWESPVADLQTLQRVATQLLVSLRDQIEPRGRLFEQLDLVLILDRREPATLEIRLAQPTCDVRHLARLLALRLEAVDLSAGVVGLRLVARRTCLRTDRQVSLFDERGPARQHELARFVDHATQRLGPRALGRANLRDEYVPERVVEWRSAAQTQSTGEPAGRVGGWRAGDAAAGAPLCRLPRPACLLPRPILVKAVSLVPEGPPTWFCWRGTERRVLRAWGPERVESGWWHAKDVRRDYFHVITERGERFWMFRCLRDGRWYVHGWFA